MNKLLKRVIAVCASVLILCYVGYQTYSAFHVSVSTQRAQLSTAQATVAAAAFILRSETLLPPVSSGIVDYLLDDGERVNRSGAVASVYPTAAQADNEQKIRALQSRIRQLEIGAVAGDTPAVDIGVLDTDIDNQFATLAQLSSGSDVDGLGSVEASFLNLLNEKQIVTGKVSGFDKELSSLTTQLAALTAKRSNAVSTVAAPVSGVFVSRADGYENRFDLSQIASITPAQVKTLLASQPVPVKAAGKVESSFEWYAVCVLGEADANRLHSGMQVEVSFAFMAGDPMPATVTALNRDSSGQCAAVLQCGEITADLACARSGELRILLGSYTGVRVDNSELRFVNGVRGVYVLDGDIVRFRPLQVIYAGDGFVISENDPYSTKQLRVNDQIIVGGKGLYDGKVIR